MSARTTNRPAIKTLAELIDRLGGVPPERIRFHPLPGTATVQDVLDIEAHEDRLCELVDGVLVEKPTGFSESRIAMLLGAALQNYVTAHDLGIVTGESGMIRMPANLVRIPDLAFFRWKKFPRRELPTAGAPEIAPDIAVEVLSESNTQKEMERKLSEYFSVGVKLVWLVDPRTRTVCTYASTTRHRVLSVGETLTGGRVLPGFEVPVGSLFANLRGKKRKER